MIRRYQWWRLLLLNLNVIQTRSDWLCWKAQAKIQEEPRFCKTIGYRCLLTSRITLKTLERRHLTTSYLPEVTLQNHVLDGFSKNIYQFAIKSLLSVLLSSSTARNFNNSRPIYVISWEMRNNYLIFDSWKIQNVSIFYF